MIAPLLALLLQAPQTATAPRTVVHVSLDSRGPLARGTSVRVYVELGEDGNLVVLHRRTDGRIEVLFPSNPAADPFVKAGTYEIHREDGRAAWVVAEPDGSGMILAALSPDPLRFDEFVRAAAWNPDALVASWSGSDGQGAMSDVVQRMLGDGYFNYDVVSYTVAPPVYAQGDVAPADTTAGYVQSPANPPCVDCTFIGEQVIIFAPFVGRHRFRGDRAGTQAPAPTSAIALALGPQAPRIPAGPTPAPQFAPPRHAPSPTQIEPRPRTHVRYTRLSTPPSDLPATIVLPRGRAPEASAGGMAPREAPAGLAVAGIAPRMRRGIVTMSAGQTARAVSRAAAPAAVAVGSAVAIPREAWGTHSQAGPARSGARVRQR